MLSRHFGMVPVSSRVARMIQDPIQFDYINTWHQLLKANVQRLIFTISVNRKTLSLGFVVNADYPIPTVKTIFSICPSDRRGAFTIGTNKVDKEEFLEYMRKNHPEYLDWLLFHKEWL